MKKIVLLALFALQVAVLPAQSLFDSLYVKHQAEVYFASGRAELSAEAADSLGRLARAALLRPGFDQLRITAHTDSVGPDGLNQALSARRAEAVRTALVRAGVPPDRVRIAAFGERLPAAPNATEDGRQRNRRATVELVVAVPMATLSGRVTDRKTGAGVPALVSFRTRARQDSVRTDSAGNYSVRLPCDSTLKIEGVARGYFFETVMTRVYGSPELARKHKQTGELRLASAKPGEIAAIRDLFFVANQAVLLRMSEPELPKVLRFMQLNPDVSIEVAGHVNDPYNLGRFDKNEKPRQLQLSIDRAKLVYDFLLQHGIEPGRMTYKGYGNTQMLFPDPDATEAEQQQNRRVEIRVVGN